MLFCLTLAAQASSLTPPPPHSPPQPPPPPYCAGAFVAASCWLLSETGETCKESCGSLSAIDFEHTLRNHWHEDVVRALSSRYRLGHLAALNDTHADDVDNGVQPIFADRLGAACGLPSAAGQSAAMYLFLPLASGWGCYAGERPDETDGQFRMPCACRPPPEVDASGALRLGALIALAVITLIRPRVALSGL